ncbi:hypothetical protein L195_g027802, partial [Trifolium pratense]
MRERGRERERGVAPRAYLGQLFRSSPSPKARQKWGGASIDSGDWTEVRRRGRKGCREEGRGRFISKQTRQYYATRSYSSARDHCFIDHHRFPNNQTHDRYRSGSIQSRYSGERRNFERRGFNNTRRQASRKNRSRSRSSFDTDRRLYHRGREESKRGLVVRRNYASERFSSRSNSLKQCRRLNQEGDCRLVEVAKASDGVQQKVGLKKNKLAKPMYGGGEIKGGKAIGEHVDVGSGENKEVGDGVNSGIKQCVDNISAKKRNKFGQPYGFVKYFNVKNVSKMTKALNNVWFGNFRVKASVAMFERRDSRVDRKMELQKDEVELGARKVNLTHQNVHKEGIVPSPEEVVTQAVTVKESKRFMKSYRSKIDDVKWASSGVVATIINREVVPLVQDRVMDAGFNDLVLIPMGADKVFLRSLAGGDVSRTVNNAKEFFQLFFSNWTSWEADAQPYRRGAWVRLYGIPLHAWNEEFFKLCVLDCGRYLRTDCCSAEKDRLDFARVLIATPSLDIINSVESILVDGGQVEVKIVEEWGYALGEDSCLVEEDNGSEAAQSECGEGHVDPEVSRDVDLLINNFTEGLEDAACADVPGLREEESLVKQKAEEPGKVLEQRPDSPRPSSNYVRPSSRDQGVRQARSSDTAEVQVRSPGRVRRVKRTNSCRPEAKRSVISGPWSLEWLNDQNHGDAGVIFSASKKGRKGNRPDQSLNSKGQHDPLKRKACGILRHPLHSIKRVARMPTKDRREVLKALKKRV